MAFIRSATPNSTLSRSTTKSTLSMMQRRATRYEKYITLASIFLVVTSTIVIFTSAVMIKWYYMPNLDFWHQYFVVAPYLMLSLGIYKFLVAIYGFCISDKKNRGLLIFLAILLVIAFIGQLGSIFLFWELRTQIQLGSVGASQIQNALRLYGSDIEVTKSWDHMQKHLSCCGGQNWQTGYRDYQNTPIGQENNSVPDSCCINGPTPGCGHGVLAWSVHQVWNHIFVQGCVQILQKWMEIDVEPMIGVYTAFGVAIALVELIAVVLASAYVAQISRRRLREDVMLLEARELDGYDSFRPNHNDRSSQNDTEV